MNQETDPKEQTTFRLEDTPNAPQVFAEGWTHVYFGYPFIRFVLHTVAEPKTSRSEEVRRVAGVITMPMVVASQLALAILSSLKANESAILNATEQSNNQMRQVLSQLPVVSKPADVKQTGIEDSNRKVD